MGFDVDDFVNPDSISRQLICAICAGVLENPVQTPCEHLFCESELLEWSLQALKCPLDNLPLDPEKVTKPSRIILNMLGELKRYCPFRERGCKWSGELQRTRTHERECLFTPPKLLFERIKRRDAKITRLKKALAAQKDANSDLKALVATLRASLNAAGKLAAESTLLSAQPPATAVSGTTGAGRAGTTTGEAATGESSSSSSSEEEDEEDDEEAEAESEDSDGDDLGARHSSATADAWRRRIQGHSGSGGSGGAGATGAGGGAGASSGRSEPAGAAKGK